MDEYRKLLTLQYIEEKETNYTIQELCERLGFEWKFGNDLLDKMFQDRLIAYNNNYLICITEKGMKFLKEVPNNYLKMHEGSIFLHDILPKLKNDDIYIPRMF